MTLPDFTIERRAVLEREKVAGRLSPAEATFKRGSLTVTKTVTAVTWATARRSSVAGKIGFGAYSFSLKTGRGLGKGMADFVIAADDLAKLRKLAQS